jgi:hypothetical protein
LKLPDGFVKNLPSLIGGPKLHGDDPSLPRQAGLGTDVRQALQVRERNIGGVPTVTLF